MSDLSTSQMQICRLCRWWNKDMHGEPFGGIEVGWLGAKAMCGFWGKEKHAFRSCRFFGANHSLWKTVIEE